MRLIHMIVLTIMMADVTLGESALRGTITDSSGAALDDAIILVHWDSSGGDRRIGNIGIKQDLVLRSSADGTFSADLVPGFYDVFVARRAFSPSCKKLRVRVGVTTVYNVQLEISALVLGETADPVLRK